MRSLLLMLLSTVLIVGCAQRGTDPNPTLGGFSQPTSKKPSPGNFQRNVMMQSSTMAAPARP